MCGFGGPPPDVSAEFYIRLKLCSEKLIKYTEAEIYKLDELVNIQACNNIDILNFTLHFVLIDMFFNNEQKKTV